MKIILLGAPGAGKGSQAAKIKDYYGLAHISTGDALRKNIANGTETGKLAESFIKAGKLVPDDVVIKIVADRIKEDDCKNGFMLDGFPRTIAQAEALDGITEIDAVIDIIVDFSVIAERLTGRRSCSCGETYHISSYSSDICAKCGSKLFIREDDKAETINNRLAVYEKLTSPLEEYYRKKGVLHEVNGMQRIDAVFEEIKGILD